MKTSEKMQTFILGFFDDAPCCQNDRMAQITVRFEKGTPPCFRPMTSHVLARFNPGECKITPCSLNNICRL